MNATDTGTVISELQISRGNRNNFPYYSKATQVVDPHQNCLTEMVLISFHNMLCRGIR